MDIAGIKLALLKWIHNSFIQQSIFFSTQRDNVINPEEISALVQIKLKITDQQ